MRQSYLDNLRWATVLVVLAYHVCYLFNAVGILGGVPAAPNVPLGDVLAATVYPWFMVLLFLVAGMSTRFALEKRGTRQFLRERTKKLLVPSTLGLFVVHWVTGYLNIKMGGGLDYIPGFLVYPISVLSGIGPLWFIQTLFLFSLALVLLKKVDRGDRLWTWCGKLPAWAVTVPPFFLLWAAAQVGNLPVLTMYRFGIYFAAFLLGYYVFSHKEHIETLAKGCIGFLLAAILAAGVYLYRFAGSDYTAPTCLQSLITNLYAWLAVLALLGLFRRCFDVETPATRYLTRAGFGLYVLHYPIFLALAYVLCTYFALSAAANYLIVLTAGTALTFAAYEAVRRVPVIRFLVLGLRKGQTAIFSSPERTAQD